MYKAEVCGMNLECDMTGFYDGGLVVVLINGVKKQRRVYYESTCGLYITVKGYKIFEYDFQ